MNVKSAETLIIERGYSKLTGEELKERIIDKTVSGDYLYGRRFKGYTSSNGMLEGENDLGVHLFGQWSIDMNNNSITMIWEGNWHNTITYAYNVESEIRFYDIDTGNWRSTYRSIEEGKKTLVVNK